MQGLISYPPKFMIIAHIFADQFAEGLSKLRVRIIVIIGYKVEIDL